MGLSSLTGSKYRLKCVLLKLASSFESLDEPLCGLILLKNERLADVELRLLEDASPSAESPNNRSSSSTLKLAILLVPLINSSHANSLHLTRDDSALNPAPILVKLPSPPLPGNASKHRIVNIQHIFLAERQLRFVSLCVAVEANADVERIASLVFDLIEF